MDQRIVSIATGILAQIDRENPADAVLRKELRRSEMIDRQDARDITQAVFAFFRWRGCLNTKSSQEAQLFQALEFAQNFHDRPGTFADEKLVELSVPSWTPNFLDVSPAWVRSLQKEPTLWLRPKMGLADKVASDLSNCIAAPRHLRMEAEAAAYPGMKMEQVVCYVGREDLFSHPSFQHGDFEIQDIASQAVGWLCDPKPGETWWDACAGEGGKTLHLSDMMQNKGNIWASDRAEWRLKKLKQRASRASCFNYRAALWANPDKLPTKTRFDGVLVDAPCSGIGTWQRNPHARWTTTPTDVKELAEVQTKLLVQTAQSVKPGGKLVYSVCTLTRPETTEVAAAFQAALPDFEPILLANPFAPAAPPVNSLTLWPQQTGGNGMFIAAWRRVK